MKQKLNLTAEKIDQYLNLHINPSSDMGGEKVIKVKRGQLWKSKDGGFTIRILSKQTGNGHWNTERVGESKRTSHKIFDKTLFKFYELID